MSKRSSFLRSTSLRASLVGLALLGGLAASGFLSPGATAAALPDPAVDTPASGQQMVVLAGGCFWGMEEVFEHVKGVTKVTVGYAGGTKETADYETVSSGTTGHAESAQIYYDPTKVSFGELLKVYFQVAHDPTELDRQGPDSGTQYRSAIFFSTSAQQSIASAYIAQLDQSKSFDGPIVTEIKPLSGFYAAEDYHQHYADQNPTNPYIVVNDLPKVQALQQELPALYAQ
jgi:peptide-methionine (S)-S-oxide reductase